jgi:hypothetical protein
LIDFNNIPKTTAEPEPVKELEIVESMCVVWFTIEFLVRFLVVADRVTFMKHYLNLIDFLTIIPFYLEMCLPLFGVNSDDFRKLAGKLCFKYSSTFCNTHLQHGTGSTHTVHPYWKAILPMQPPKRLHPVILNTQ